MNPSPCQRVVDSIGRGGFCCLFLALIDWWLMRRRWYGLYSQVLAATASSMANSTVWMMHPSQECWYMKLKRELTHIPAAVHVLSNALTSAHTCQCASDYILARGGKSGMSLMKLLLSGSQRTHSSQSSPAGCSRTVGSPSLPHTPRAPFQHQNPNKPIAIQEKAFNLPHG